MISCLQKFFSRRKEKCRMTFGVGLIPRIVNIIFAIPIFSIIGKKINQSSVSDADQEIPTIGSTDNAENSVSLISGIIRFSLGVGISLS